MSLSLLDVDALSSNPRVRRVPEDTVHRLRVMSPACVAITDVEVAVSLSMPAAVCVLVALVALIVMLVIAVTTLRVHRGQKPIDKSMSDEVQHQVPDDDQLEVPDQGQLEVPKKDHLCKHKETQRLVGSNQHQVKKRCLRCGALIIEKVVKGKH